MRVSALCTRRPRHLCGTLIEELLRVPMLPQHDDERVRLYEEPRHTEGHDFSAFLFTPAYACLLDDETSARVYRLRRCWPPTQA